jgi:WD40 repeat protein
MISATVPFAVGALAWGPDGRTIVAGASGLTFDESKVHGIAVLDADSGRLLRLVDRLWTGGLSVSQDGQLIGVQSKDSADPTVTDTGFRVLDAATGKELWHTNGFVTEHAFSPDSTVVVTSTFLESYRMLPARTGTPVTEVGDGGMLPRLTPVFSADGRWLVIATRTSALVLDGHTGERVAEVPTPDGATIFRIAFGEGDQRFALITGSGQVRVVDTGTWTVTAEVRLEGIDTVPMGPIEDLLAPTAFSPDTDRVAVRAANGLAAYSVVDGRRLWDPRPMPMPTRNTRVLFSPNGRYVAVNQVVGTQPARGITVLDAATGQTVLQDGADKTLVIAFSPDGTRIAAGGQVTNTGLGFVRRYDLGRPTVRCALSSSVTGVAVSQGPARFLLASAAEKVSLFQADAGTFLLERAHPGAVTSVAFGPDGQDFVTGCADGGVRAFATASGLPSWKTDHDRAVNAVALAGSLVATASADKTARLLDLASGAEKLRLTHPASVSQVALSPAGDRVATGCADRITRIFATDHTDELYRVEHDGPVRALSFAGPLVVTAASEIVVVLDTTTGLRRAEIGHPQQVSTAALSPDGALLATGGAEQLLRVYDVTGEAPVLLWQRRFGTAITRLAFHPVDRQLAVVLDDPVVRLLDPESGAEHHRLIHSAPVLDLAFSADGELVVTESTDDAASIFPAR